jgi:hypothetical protein
MAWRWHHLGVPEEFSVKSATDGTDISRH